MGESLFYLVIVVIVFFWVIIPIYRKITGTNIDSDLFCDELEKREEALKKINIKTSEKKLLNIYKKANYPEVKRKTLRLSKSINPFDILNSDENDDLKEIALKKIKGETELRKIVVDPNINDELKKQALKRIKDKKFIMKTALSGLTAKIRSEALKRIDDQDSLGELVIVSENDKTRKHALRRITAENVLFKIALAKIDRWIRFAAAEKMKNEDSFIRLARSNTFKEMKLLAYEKISSNEVLLDLMNKEKNAESLLSLIEKTGEIVSLSEEDLLKVIKHSKNDEITLKLVKRLESENSFIQIFNSNKNNQIRMRALEKIGNEEKRRELISREKDVMFLKRYVEDNEKNASIVMDVAQTIDSNVHKIMAFEINPLVDMSSSLEMLKIILSKKGLENYLDASSLFLFAAVPSAYDENETIKKEIIKRKEELKRTCLEIIVNKEDMGPDKKPDNVKKMIDISNSFEEVISSFEEARDLRDFLILYMKYWRIMNVKEYFYDQRNDYLEKFRASHDLTDMGEYYEVDSRLEKENLDFQGIKGIHQILFDVSHMKPWWEEAVVKAWLDNIALFLYDDKVHSIPTGLKIVTLLMSMDSNKKFRGLLTSFATEKCDELKKIKTKPGFNDGLNAYLDLLDSILRKG